MINAACATAGSTIYINGTAANQYTVTSADLGTLTLTAYAEVQGQNGMIRSAESSVTLTVEDKPIETVLDKSTFTGLTSSYTAKNFTIPPYGYGNILAKTSQREGNRRKRKRMERDDQETCTGVRIRHEGGQGLSA